MMRGKAGFWLGALHITDGVSQCGAPGEYKADLIRRHLDGDWGLMPPEDAADNARNVTARGRIFSAYPIDPAKPSAGYGANTIWVITDPGHEITTILLPEEY